MTRLLLLLALPLFPSLAAADAPPLGLNLTAVRDYASEYPFVDVFRSARSWVSQQQGGKWGTGGELALGDDGYPTRFRPGQYATTIVLNAPGFPVGEYTLLHEGRGKLRLKGDLRVVNETPGKIVFEKGPKPNVLIDLLETDDADPLRNIRIYMPGAPTDGSVLFASRFLKRTDPFACLRFMDWMDTNGSTIRQWEERPQVDDFSWSSHGVPAETMVDLANKLQSDAWFCVPHLADDNYVRQLAELVKSRLDGGLKVYIEHSNEVWNGQFAQAKYAANQGLMEKLSRNSYQAQLLYHARRSAKIGRIFNTVFSDEDRVVVVYGSQSVNPWVTEQVLSDPEVAAVCDAIAVAPYFGGKMGRPKDVAATLAMSLEQQVAALRESIAENEAALRKHKRLCDQHGCDLIAYEGGQHLVGTGGAENNKELQALFHDLNRWPEMETLYREAIASWQQAGGGLYVVFSSVSVPSKWGSWGMLEYDDQPASEAPKYRAVQSLLAE